MIKGNLQKMGDYVAKEPLLAPLADFLSEKKPEELEVGKYMIDGDRVYAKVQQYVTKKYEDAKFEAHDLYIDVQCIVSGEEAIYVTDREDMTVKTPYNAEKDVIFYEDAEAKDTVVLKDMEFLVLYPQEAHKPGVAPNEQKEVKKIVFKVHI